MDKRGPLPSRRAAFTLVEVIVVIAVVAVLVVVGLQVYHHYHAIQAP